MPRLKPTAEDRAALDGDRGEAVRLAMRVVATMAEAVGAPRLRDVTRAHIDGALYHGRASLDFARRLADAGAAVAVPTTLNVGSLDLLHPERFRGDPSTGEAARHLMEAYVAMGCRPTWTCAPYQVDDARPEFGEHVAWAESNAIVFANSVLGARTERYGDFIDICAAITGRVPDTGLHLDEPRRARLRIRLTGVSATLLAEDALYPVLGHLVGRASGTLVPVIEGLPPDVPEDRLKALGAAAASSGAVALFHAVGVTPEAATLAEATGGRDPVETLEVTPAALRGARDELSTVAAGGLDAISLGTPHYSLRQVERLADLASRFPVARGVAAFVSTGRDVLAEAEGRGWADAIRSAGWRFVTDTCTYITPILDPATRTAMTDSGKWAYYAPGNLGLDVAFGSVEECVRSAAAGAIVRDDGLWDG